MKQKSGTRSGAEDFAGYIASGEPAPVLVFSGDQSYLIDMAVAGLREKLLGPSGDINYVVFSGESASGKEIADNASTYPMFSKKKLVVVKNADKLSAKELAALEPYLASPSPSACLVLIFGEGKKPKLGGGKNAAYFDFSLEKGGAVTAVREEARKLGYEINRAGADALIGLVGEDLQEIHNELVKISVYKGDRKTIGPEDVEALTKKTKFADIYQLINAISRRDKRTAHRVLGELEAAGEEPLSILGLISWRFRLIWRAKELQDRRLGQSEILKELKISPGQLYYLSEDLKKFTYEDIERIMGALAECDKKLKLSYVPKSFVLTKLVIELCARG
ncbi:MAG: DNA polymerase III subunit delta [Thermodesulfobacteriota bacterium]